jgi:hypothetical protein
VILVKADTGSADPRGVLMSQWSLLSRWSRRAPVVVVTPDEIEAAPEPYVRPTHTAGTGGTMRIGVSVVSLLVAQRDGRSSDAAHPV